jgi:hypothetical protein
LYFSVGTRRGHVVVLEVDNEHFDLRASDLLPFDCDDLANAVLRIDNMLSDFEAVTFGIMAQTPQANSLV